MHKSATKCNETIGKWCKNKHGASKIIDTLETYHYSIEMFTNGFINMELDMGDEGVGGFRKNGIVYKCSPNQLLPCNHITPVWDGA
jgi:hypothetical protein